LFRLLEESQRPIFDHRVVELEIWNAPILKDLRCLKSFPVVLLATVMLFNDVPAVTLFCSDYPILWFGSHAVKSSEPKVLPFMASLHRNHSEECAAVK
jgi:hypothetical protein